MFTVWRLSLCGGSIVRSCEIWDSSSCPLFKGVHGKEVLVGGSSTAFEIHSSAPFLECMLGDFVYFRNPRRSMEM